MMMMMSFAI